MTSWEQDKLTKQTISEEDFSDFVRKEHAQYQKQVKHLDDYISYYEYYLELASVYGRKTKGAVKK